MRRHLPSVKRKWLGLLRLLPGPGYLLKGDTRFNLFLPQPQLWMMLEVVGRRGEGVRSLYYLSGGMLCRGRQLLESITEPSNYNWHYYKEDYYKCVCSYNYVVDLVISEQGSGLTQFSAN